MEDTALKLHERTGVAVEVLLRDPLLPAHSGDYRSTLHTLWTLYKQCHALMSGDWLGGHTMSLHLDTLSAEVAAIEKLVKDVQRRFFVSDSKAWRLLRESDWDLDRVSSKIQLNKSYPLADHPQLRQIYMSFFSPTELCNLRSSNVAVSDAVDNYIEDQCVEHVTFLMRDYGSNEDEGSAGSLKDALRSGPGTTHFDLAQQAPNFQPVLTIEDITMRTPQPPYAVSVAPAIPAPVVASRRVDVDWPNQTLKLVDASTDGSLDVEYTFAPTAGSANRCHICSNTTPYSSFRASTPSVRFICKTCAKTKYFTPNNYDVKYAGIVTTRPPKPLVAGTAKAGNDLTTVHKEATVPFDLGCRYLKLLHGLKQHHQHFVQDLFRRLELPDDLLDVTIFYEDGTLEAISTEELEDVSGWLPPPTHSNLTVLKLPWKVVTRDSQALTLQFKNVVIEQATDGEKITNRGLVHPMPTAVPSMPTPPIPWGPHTCLVLADWYSKIDSGVLKGAYTKYSRALPAYVAIRQLVNPKHDIEEFSDQTEIDAAAPTPAGLMGGPAMGQRESVFSANSSSGVLVDLTGLPHLRTLDVSCPVLLRRADGTGPTITELGKSFSGDIRGWIQTKTANFSQDHLQYCGLRPGEGFPSIFEGLSEITEIPEGSFGQTGSTGKSVNLCNLLSLKHIGETAFRGSTLVMADLGAPQLARIDDSVLTGCTSLRALSLEGAINLVSIGHDFARGCSTMRNMALPKSESLTSIGSGFLCDCPLLTALDFGRVPKLANVGHWCVSDNNVGVGSSLTSSLGHLTGQMPIPGKQSKPICRLRVLDLTALHSVLSVDMTDKKQGVVLHPSPYAGVTLPGGPAIGTVRAFSFSAWKELLQKQGTRLVLTPKQEAEFQEKESTPFGPPPPAAGAASPLTAGFNTPAAAVPVAVPPSAFVIPTTPSPVPSPAAPATKVATAVPTAFRTPAVTSPALATVSASPALPVATPSPVRPSGVPGLPSTSSQPPSTAPGKPNPFM